MELSSEEYSEVFERVSAKFDPKSDEFEDEMELQVTALACMKSLRNDVLSWPVRPNEERLQSLAEIRACVELAGDRATLLTGVARKDVSEKERAEIKQVEAEGWLTYLQLSEYQREFEKCLSVGNPVPQFLPFELEEA